MTYFAEHREGNCDSPGSYYRSRQRRRERRASPGGEAPARELSVARVADHENLLAVFDRMKARAGRAPGIDRVTYADLGRSEIAAILRFYAQVCRAGHYRPAPSRQVSIAKSGGHGHRTLKLRATVDRVISGALNRAMAPFWERRFLPISFGYRPRRSHHDLLADLLATMVAERRFVVAIDDVRDAFDSINIADVVDDHRRNIEDEELVDLVERVLRGGDDVDRAVGIHQGDPFSPTALNVRLHFAHDVPLSGERRHPPAYRYADNVAYLRRSVPEGLLALLRSRRLLAQSGLDLKGDDGPPADLRSGAEAQFLGFTLRLEDGRPCLGPGGCAWEGLEQGLVLTHERANPPEAARSAVLGWIAAHGPAFERCAGPAIGERILRVAMRMGFRELCSRDELHGRLEGARASWEACRREACRRRGIVLEGLSLRGGSAAHRQSGAIN